MASRLDKATGDIVFDGFEQGISPSPHSGVANIQNANIDTEIGEAMASFARQQQSMTDTSATGTLAYADSTHVSLSIPNSNNLFKGQWITVTNSSHTGELPNGTYYVPPSTGSNFQLANYYNVSATADAGSHSFNYLVVAGGGGGGNATTVNGDGAGAGGAGGLKSGTTSLTSYTAYTGSVGDGGTAGNNGSDSTFNSITSTGGGKGGNAGTGGAGGNGSTGGSGGGGGGGTSGGTGAAGTAGQGNSGDNGGAGGTNAVGGGGGGSGGAASGTTGGTGTANSISGASVTYAAGGAGGNGSGTGANGAAGASNTGNGGGGATASISSGSFTGGKGGSGVVVLSIATGIVSNPSTAAYNGTYTTSGGNDIWTFSTVGTIVFTPIFTNTPAPTNVLSGFTAGLTATIALVNPMGKPISKATEPYLRSGVQYYRYYILDNNNIVWVYDTYNETLYSSSDNVGWFVPDYKTDWCTRADSIAILDGMLIAAAKSGMYAKPTVQLGGINTQNTTWAEFSGDVGWQGNASANHFGYVGHQGYYYVTDGNYIRSVFPDTTLIQKVSGTTQSGSSGSFTTGDNVQSMGSWSVNTNRNSGGKYVYATPSPVDGSLPFPEDGKPVPVIFFTDGTLPTAINANQVYYIQRNSSGSYNDFVVGPIPSLLNSGGADATMTAMPATGAVSATLTAAWTYPTDYYVAEFTYSGGTETRNVLLTNNSTAIVWNTPLTHDTTSATLHVEGYVDINTGAVGNQYYATFFPTSSGTGGSGSDVTVNQPMYVLSTQRLTLPNFETSQCMTEIGNQVIIGCKSNIAYPWDQVSNLPYSIISLPESDVQSILTVNQIAYLFAGHKGNIYITDGSIATLALKVPDYVAGVPGSPATYVGPTFSWGDTMYTRGRVYFSVIDQTSTKAGNCGGVWSFIPTQNFYLGQDVGLALRLENQNSYGTYNGGVLVLLPRQSQTTNAPLYWSAWESDITTPVYGIDYSTQGTNASFQYIIETDAIETGTMLEKKTFKQIEYKMASPLDNGATVSIKYRQSLTDAWATTGSVNADPGGLSGYFTVSFEKGQWLQLQATVTPITSTASSNTFARLKELRVR